VATLFDKTTLEPIEVPEAEIAQAIKTGGVAFKKTDPVYMSVLVEKLAKRLERVEHLPRRL
jgi:hypothetical protein